MTREKKKTISILPTDDPFGILAAVKNVMGKTHYVSINQEKVPFLAEMAEERLMDGLESPASAFGSAGNFDDDVQLVFLEDAVNFNFWADFGMPRWQVGWPHKYTPTGGWYSLANCFRRALDKKIHILDANSMATLDADYAKWFFMGDGHVQIPLFAERVYNLREAGKVLNEKYKGKFANVLGAAEYDALKIVKLLYDDFPSFRDEARLGRQPVRFLKRAQICAMDLSYVAATYGKKITNIDKLTAFADYRLPQILRNWHVITYEPQLAEKVDRRRLIKQGSREEIEIRSATIWCVELMRRYLGEYTASEIDNALWLISQDREFNQPYHRTRSIYY